MAEKQIRLPGASAPSELVIEKHQAIIEAFQEMHAALSRAFESLPAGGVITVARTVKGDVIKVSFRQGEEIE